MSREMKVAIAVCVVLVVGLSCMCGVGVTTALLVMKQSNDLKTSASGVPEVDPSTLMKSDIDKRVVVSGTVQTRVFQGFEGRELMEGRNVMAEMYVELATGNAKVHCLFLPTNNRSLLPEIKTSIKVIGVVESVHDNRTKAVFLRDCQFVR